MELRLSGYGSVFVVVMCLIFYLIRSHDADTPGFFDSMLFLTISQILRKLRCNFLKPFYRCFISRLKNPFSGKRNSCIRFSSSLWLFCTTLIHNVYSTS